MTLSPHPLLVPRSRKSRAIPLLPLWTVQPVQNLSACTRVHFTFPFYGCFLTHWNESSQVCQRVLEQGDDRSAVDAVRLQRHRTTAIVHWNLQHYYLGQWKNIDKILSTPTSATKIWEKQHGSEMWMCYVFELWWNSCAGWVQPETSLQNEAVDD